MRGTNSTAIGASPTLYTVVRREGSKLMVKGGRNGCIGCTSLSTICSVELQWTFSEHSLILVKTVHLQWKLNECSLNILFSSVNVQLSSVLFIHCSVNVQLMFSNNIFSRTYFQSPNECSPNIHWTFTEHSLSISWNIVIHIQWVTKSNQMTLVLMAYMSSSYLLKLTVLTKCSLNVQYTFVHYHIEICSIIYKQATSHNI